MEKQASAFVSEVDATSSRPPLTSFDKLKTTVKLIWFLTVSIAALSLSVAVAFSDYDPTTSKVAISSIRPLQIINSLDGFINPDGSVSNSTVGGSNSTATAEMLEPFALDILPYEYRFGMAGICRLYNTSKPNTTCTRSLGNTPSILSVLATDLNSTILELYHTGIPFLMLPKQQDTTNPFLFPFSANSHARHQLFF